MLAPILGEGHDDADKPNSSRGRAVNRESCPDRIQHHSPRSSSTSHRTSTTQAGIRETTNKVRGSRDMYTSGKSNETVHSYQHHSSHLHREYSRERKHAPAEKLHSRWSSSARVMVDKPPSQPLSYRRQMLVGGGSGRRVSPVKKGGEIRKRPRLQRSDSMWTSGGAGTTKDRPPLQPFRAGSTRTIGARLQRSGSSRWSSSSRAAADTPPSNALARRDPVIVEESSSVSAALLQQPKRHHSIEMHSIETKQDRADTFEITLMALSIFNMTGKPQALLKTAVRRMPPASLRRSKSQD
jgi:hypothetical protein